MRVLYIDDDRINTMLFVETCRFAGHEDVETATSGAEALELVRQYGPQSRPELLVLDQHLPDTLGTELLPQLHAALGGPPVRAFLCTADEAALVAEAARAAGFSGCWTKPVDLQAVLAELARNGDSGAPPAADP